MNKGNKMTWKYALIEHEEPQGLLKVVKKRGSDTVYCYIRLDANDWCFATKEDAIETLKLILRDLENNHEAM